LGIFGGSRSTLAAHAAKTRGEPTEMPAVKTILTTVIATLSAAVPAKSDLPAGVAGQLLPGYTVISTANIAAGRPLRRFVIVALSRKDEDRLRQSPGGSPVRPLLVFEQSGARFTLSARNDHVVMAADKGGQCDPFLDNEARIAVKGRYFTVENGVACGQHWTDYITFRWDDRSGAFVFDNERREDWMLNPRNDPDAEALVRAGPPRVISERPGHVTPFASWRPRS